MGKERRSSKAQSIVQTHEASVELEALLGLGFEIRLQPVQAVQMPAVSASHAVAAELSPAGGRTEGVLPELSSETLLSRLGARRIGHHAGITHAWHWGLL